MRCWQSKETRESQIDCSWYNLLYVSYFSIFLCNIVRYSMQFFYPTNTWIIFLKTAYFFKKMFFTKTWEYLLLIFIRKFKTNAHNPTKLKHWKSDKNYYIIKDIWHVPSSTNEKSQFLRSEKRMNERIFVVALYTFE